MADTPLTSALQIGAYMHCGKCLDEWRDPHHADSAGHSPQTYAALSVGWTKQGLQVWCYRHRVNVLHVDFEGQKHPANTTAAEPADD